MQPRKKYLEISEKVCIFAVSNYNKLNMKKQVHLAVLWLCLWVGWGAEAQEFTRDVDFKDFYSYVREVRRGSGTDEDVYQLHTIKERVSENCNIVMI